MARVCTIIGGALTVLGVALALAFVVAMSRDDAYRKAELAAARNPGNVMYEAEFGVARVRRGFQLVGVVAGVLLGVNGTTLVGLGVVAGRLRRAKP
jgi:hypothetical protein